MIYNLIPKFHVRHKGFSFHDPRKSDKGADKELIYTLQELKLQGIKIRDGVAFSQYSQAQCFGINLSDFGKMPKYCVA